MATENAELLDSKNQYKEHDESKCMVRVRTSNNGKAFMFPNMNALPK